MPSRTLFPLLLAAVGLLAACGGNVQIGSSSNGGSGGSGTTAGGSAGSAGSTVSSGDCQGQADCGGAECAPLSPGGYNVCLQLPPESNGCDAGGNPPDQCCTTMDCKEGGKCYSSTVVPLCGGVQPVYNECVLDECKTDSDCKLGVPALCVPAGAYGPMRRCVVAYCKTNADCGAEPGGICAPIQNPCCELPLGIACVYPGGCHKQAECNLDSSNHCDIDPSTKRGVCMSGLLACPE